jgi:signal transduction histidine kinase/CheY-like chemotaxis protein
LRSTATYDRVWIMDDRHVAGIWHDPFTFDGALPPGQLEGELARRTVRVGLLFAAVAAAAFGALYQLGGPEALAVPNAIAGVLLILVAIAPGWEATLKLYAAITIAMGLLGSELLLLGRVDNGITVWFLVPNVGATLLGMRRAATYCATASVAEIVAVVVAGRLGWLPAGIDLPDGDLVMAASMLAVLALCVMFATIALRARRRLLSDVEARTAQLATALDEAHAARAVAIDAAAAKDRFFANLTHEIRTPLNGIAGTAELLQAKTLLPEQEPLVRALGASTVSLVALVNAMLDHARLSAGHATVDARPVEPRRIAGDLADLFRAKADERGLELDVVVQPHVPGWVVSDPIKLAQILGNLVANAIKFTERGAVRVTFDHRRAASATPRPATLVVAVTDTGIGIPEDKISLVFEPFVQGDESIGRAYGGTGLGLAIARQLTQLLGGTLRLDSRPDGGTRFTLEVPAPAASPPAASGQVEIRRRAIDGLRILLVEDNAINRTVASAMLRRSGAGVEVAFDGLQAVELALGGAFDVVLMDLQMPGLDGIEATWEIRRRERAVGRPSVPILAMSGNSPEDYGEACAAAGMSGFLMKPVGSRELERALGDLADRCEEGPAKR